MFRTRREMMKLLGIAPFLAPAFRDVLAADSPALKRLVIMMRYNGAPTETWFPKDWNNFGGSCLESLNDQKLKSKLTVIKNMSNEFAAGAGDHHEKGTNGSWLAQASATGITLDQYIANEMKFPTERKNLLLGVNTDCDKVVKYTFYKENGSPADMINSPYLAIKSVFGSFTKMPSGGGGEADAGAVALLAKKKSILDALAGELSRMKNNLVGAEKAKFESHLDFVRSAETSLTNTMGTLNGMCAKMPEPNTQASLNFENLPQIVNIHTDLVTMAMACDISRVFVIQMLGSYTNVTLPNKVGWCDIDLNNQKGGDGPRNVTDSLHQFHHSYANDQTRRKVYTSINAAYAKLFGQLMTKLDAVQDGTGTLLDNSISVLASEYGGNDKDGDQHDHQNLPYLIGGGGGGYLKTNGFFDAGGQSHTKFLGNLMEYFGLEDGSGQKSKNGFGNRSKNYVPFAGLKKA